LLRIRIERLLAAALLCFTVAGLAEPQPVAGEPQYPYRSAEFTQFVLDSDHQTDSATPHDFYAWMEYRFPLDDSAPAGKSGTPLTAELDKQRRLLAHIADPARKTAQELAIAAWVHHGIKKLMPHFSLAAGYEFTNAVRHGERQCLLQSVLAVGLFQRMGIDSGVVMVWKSNNGQVSNNGHACDLLALPNGRHVLVDCSDKSPFVLHQGLFGTVQGRRGYAFVEPQYVPGTAFIRSFADQATTEQTNVSTFGPLDSAFLRSQFDYYRGEQTRGGLLSDVQTRSGLEAEARHLQTSVARCSQNPLAVYMLGRVYIKEGNMELAQKQLTDAKQLYSRYGWLPRGLRDALAEAGM
jgi:hypothetical protein